MRHRGMWGVVGSVAVAALLAGCGHGMPDASRKPPSTTSTTSRAGGATGSATTTTTTTTAVTTAEEAATLPVVSCPTTFAITTPPPTVLIPASLTVDVPAALAHTLAVYVDSNSIMRLLAPKGWKCAASFGADGSGIFTIVPKGGPLPTGLQEPNSSDQAISATETGGSPVQAAGDACAYFPAAAAAAESDLGQGCSPRPTSETVDPINSNVVAFEDPAGVKGSGDPSGGQYPANGVMTYSPTNEPGFYLDTCTLPQSDHVTCTAVLNDFVLQYGQG
jgi:hypothetical protein